MNRYYHVHYDDPRGHGAVDWFQTRDAAYRFMARLDEIGIPCGYPVGSEMKCRVCD